MIPVERCSEQHIHLICGGSRITQNLKRHVMLGCDPWRSLKLRLQHFLTANAEPFAIYLGVEARGFHKWELPVEGTKTNEWK